MRVLIVKTSSMGDVLHTLPALTDAMNALPDIHFDWVVEEGFAQIPGWHPAVDKVLSVAIRRWRKNWFSAPVRAERKAFYQDLSARNYNLIIDAQGLIKSAALVTRKAHGFKHGLDWHSAREPLASLFYNRRYTINKKLHAVERTRLLFAKSLGYAEPQKRGDYAIANQFGKTKNDESVPYVIFLHATTREAKHWPEEKWRDLIQLMHQTGLRIKLPWGSEHERERAQRLAMGVNYVEVLPRLPLEQVAQQLAQAQAVVSVDTGLSHLAAALDKPNITLYGPTDPGLIGGYGKHQHIIIGKENNMANITGSEVFNDLKTLIFSVTE